MKKEGEKLRFWRIALGMAGLVIVVVSGISLAAFMGQKRVPAQPQEEKAVNEPVKFQDEQAVNEPTQPQEKQEVVLWVMGDFPLLKECVRNFNEGDHGYQVMIHNCYSEEQNVSWESALLRMQMALSGSTGPDIMLVESLDVDALAEQGMLEDLTPYFAQSVCLHQDDFLESVTASYTYDGKWIALPRDQRALRRSNGYQALSWLLFVLEPHPRAVLHTGRYAAGDPGSAVGRYHGMEFSPVLFHGSGSSEKSDRPPASHAAPLYGRKGGTGWKRESSLSA